MNTSANRHLLTTVLNELINVNTRRIAYYKNANEFMNDNVDLKSIFAERIHQSENFIDDLASNVFRIGDIEKNEDTETNALNSFKFLKGNSLNKNAAILDGCENGEDAAVKAYESGLRSPAYMEAETRRQLLEQQSEIKDAHMFIKKFRDLNLDLTT
jgi:uncharacterized protein (TIGR02284 family)